MNNREKLLESLSINKLLLKYSIPSIVSMVVVSLYNIVDRIFIGHGVGATAISGLSLTFPLMSMVAAIGTLVGVGSSARISIVLGMKDYKWARQILGNAVILTGLLSALLITVSMIFLDPILVLFGGSEATMPYAREYLLIVIPGSIFTNMCFSFSNIIKATGFPTKAMLVILSGVILNIILDPILIMYCGLGIKGAAIATVISMFVSAVIAFLHFTNPLASVHFSRKSFKLKGYIVRNIISIGMAPFLMNLLASLVNILLNNVLVKHGGDLAIGAVGIIGSYQMLLVMIIMGLSQGMQPIVGYNYGAGRIKRMKDTLLLTIKTAIIVMSSGFILVELFAPQLVSVFNAGTSPEELLLRDMASAGLRISFLMFPVIGFQIVISNFFLSISKAKQSVFMTLTRQVIFLIPMLYFFSEKWGLYGVWASIPASDLLATITAYIFIMHEKKRLYGNRDIAL